MSFLIRDARTVEASILSELAFRSKAHWGYDSDFMEACRAELTYDSHDIENDRIRFCAGVENGHILGFHAVEYLDSETCELEALFVEPEFIGKGYGRKLIEHAVELSAASGAVKLVIQGDPHAELFYLAAGAVRTGIRESVSIPGRQLPLYTIDLAEKQRARQCRK